MIERLRPVLILIAILWVVTIVDTFAQLGLTRFGVRPRIVEGLIGVPLMPFLHAGFEHLIANTVPLLVLGYLASLGRRGGFVALTVPLVLLSGLGTWALATEGVHVGASGLIFAYFGCVVARGIFGGQLGALLIGLLAVALYGGIVFGVLPSGPQISWEAHLSGLVSGIFVGALTPGSPTGNCKPR